MAPGRGGPTVARLQLGTQLRALRGAAGIDGPGAAEAIGASTSKVSRIESGLAPIRDGDLLDLLDLYQVSQAEREAMLALAKASRNAGWWADFRDLQGPRRVALEREAEGSVLRVFDPFAVPAVLQTTDYARALCEAYDPLRLQWRGGLSQAVLAHRRAAVTGPGGPAVWAVITESVLRRAPQGNRAILSAQIAALRAAAGKPDINIQIVPDEDAANQMAAAPFTIVRYDGADVKDVVVIEELTSMDIAVDLTRVDMYRHVWFKLATSALTPAESLKIFHDPARWLQAQGRRLIRENRPSPAS